MEEEESCISPEKELQNKMFEAGCLLCEIAYKLPENSKGRLAFQVAFDLVSKALEEHERQNLIDLLRSL